MECREFEVTASAYLDRQLTAAEADDYREHLSVCGGCRTRLSEIEQVSLLIRRSPEPEVPRELRSYVMTAVARQKSKQLTLADRLSDLLLRLNPRPVSYSVGVIVSSLLFWFTMLSFRPIPILGADGREMAVSPVAIGPAVTGSNAEFNSYNNMPTDAGAKVNENYYALPRVLGNSSLVGFSHIAYQKAGDEGLKVLVEVSPDGRAKILQVLSESQDSYLVEQLWWSLNDPTFQPATVLGRPVPTRIVLVVEKMDVTG